MTSSSTARHDAGQPGTGFEQFAFAPSIQRGIAGLGFTKPRPIEAPNPQQNLWVCFRFGASI